MNVRKGLRMLASEKIIYALLVGTSGFFAPIWILILWMTIFVMFDLVSGLMAAKKRGELLESRKLRRTITKLTWYFIAVLLAHGLDVCVIPLDDLHLAGFMAAIIGGVEIYSMLENAYCITGNRVFRLLTQFTTKKIKDITSIEIDKGETNGK